MRDWVVVDAPRNGAIRREFHPRPGPQHLDPLEQRVVAEAVLEGHVFDERGQRDGRRALLVGEDRLALRSEHVAVRRGLVVQGLRAETVASQEEPLLDGVPDRKSEDTVETVEQPVPPFLPAVDKNLAVSTGSEDVTARDEQATKLAVVVDLAVVGEPNALIFVRHRTPPGLREVDDGQSSMG